MSPLDAQMLKLFRVCNHVRGIAIADFIKEGQGEGFNSLIENIPEVTPEGCSHEKAARSIVSLERFGIISIPEDTYLLDKDRYAVFENIPLYLEYLSISKQDGWKLSINKHVAVPTILGEDFIRVCLD